MDVKRLQQRLADAGFYHQTVDGGLGRGTYAALFSYMARLDLGAKGLAIGAGCAANLAGAGINTELRLAHFLAQTATETGGYKTLEENLAYSAAGLMAIFPKYFPSLKSTNGFVMNPSAPSRVTSTASRTVPNPVMAIAMMSGYRANASSST